MKPGDTRRSDWTGNLSRRAVLGGTTMVAAGALFTGKATALEVCTRSAVTDTGPFFPAGTIPQRWDLIGTPHPAGLVLDVVGVVKGTDCTPLSDVVVTSWQADSRGRYDHPAAQNDGPLDPGFAYFGQQLTREDGSYRIRTLLPAPYAFMGLRRAPHIHFSVAHASMTELVTELYFDGAEDDERRARDAVWASRNPATRDTMIQTLHQHGETAIDREIGDLWCRYDFTLAERSPA